MKLTEFSKQDLVTPDQFTLVSQDDLFDKLVTTVNDELIFELDSENERYDTADAHIEAVLTDRDFDDEISQEMINEVCKLYMSVGWRLVTYEHNPETDDEYEAHIFKFYFKHGNETITV